MRLRQPSSAPWRPGIGLHSGVPVILRIVPAPAATGIVFVRTDLDRFEIPASWRHVARVSYATSLMRQGVLISTTEHLLSVLYSMGVDNAYVEIDNLEVPILDGSGMPFVGLHCGRRASGVTAASAGTCGSGGRYRGGQGQAHLDSARGLVPADVRYSLRSPAGGAADAGDGGDAGARMPLRSRPARTFGFE